MSSPSIDELKGILENIEMQISKAKMLLDGELPVFGESETDFVKKAAKIGRPSEPELSHGRVIEGVFDGQKMIGPDGKQYSVPANYISKSKLVEGDILKLTIDDAGNFVYKQIGPMERDRLVGRLVMDDAGEYAIMAEGKLFKAILASVTYFKGEAGDEVIILVPKGVESQYAAIENVIKK